MGTALSGFAPLIHGIKLFGFSQMVKQSGILYYFGEGILLIIGVFFYAVSIQTSYISMVEDTKSYRHGSLNLLDQVDMIFLDPLTRSFMSL